MKVVRCGPGRVRAEHARATSDVVEAEGAVVFGANLTVTPAFTTRDAKCTEGSNAGNADCRET